MLRLRLKIGSLPDLSFSPFFLSIRIWARSHQVVGTGNVHCSQSVRLYGLFVVILFVAQVERRRRMMAVYSISRRATVCRPIRYTICA
jgi:hypothetical protein